MRSQTLMKISVDEFLVETMALTSVAQWGGHHPAQP